MGIAPRWNRAPSEAFPPDTGCNVSPSCLACPLPHCKHDEPKMLKRLELVSKYRRADLLVIRGARIIDAAAAAGVSLRAYHRWRQKGREENARGHEAGTGSAEKGQASIVI